nr:MAG TPA: hypothetical protein [Caudoviricetes sp.]
MGRHHGLADRTHVSNGTAACSSREAKLSSRRCLRRPHTTRC